MVRAAFLAEMTVPDTCISRLTAIVIHLNWPVVFGGGCLHITGVTMTIQMRY
jgi:hypothetical protein